MEQSTATLHATAQQVVTFALDGERFAIDADLVREILDVVPVTEVPHAQPHVNGLINVRGKVVPLADLRLRLDMPRTEATIDTRIVVVEVELDGPTVIGLLADKVFEVSEIALGQIEETPRIGMKWRPEYFRGIGNCDGEFVILLDVARVFACNEQGRAAATETPATALQTREDKPCASL